jgi:16S rRNA (uracil1498-N3)-methyltransferase
LARYDFATHRLHVDAPLRPHQAVALTPERFNYLAHVLRMPEGGKLLAFNGEDGEWQAQFRFAGKKSGEIVPLEEVRPQTVPGRIHLAFAPIKSARLDYLIQKAVEMGAASLTPVLTKRTQVRGLKPQKLRAHVVEAAEQCGVLSLPGLEPEVPLDRFLSGLSSEQTLVFCDEDAGIADPVAALRAAAPSGPIAVLIGPEGGFTDEERSAIVQAGRVIRLSLGPRILRADTAAVAALAAVQIALGDWRSDTRM